MRERIPGQPSWRSLSAMVTAGSACVHCGAEEDLVAHHKLPRRYGGQDLYENLEAVCRSCHPRVEQDAVAEAKLVWESPVPEGSRQPRRRRSLPRPY